MTSLEWIPALAGMTDMGLIICCGQILRFAQNDSEAMGLVRK